MITRNTWRYSQMCLCSWHKFGFHSAFAVRAGRSPGGQGKKHFLLFLTPFWRWGAGEDQSSLDDHCGAKHALWKLGRLLEPWREPRASYNAIWKHPRCPGDTICMTLGVFGVAFGSHGCPRNPQEAPKGQNSRQKCFHGLHFGRQLFTK